MTLAPVNGSPGMQKDHFRRESVGATCSKICMAMLRHRVSQVQVQPSFFAQGCFAGTLAIPDANPKHALRAV
jgi:hypothetical protein